MKDLYETIIDKRNKGYLEGIHYRYFNSEIHGRTKNCAMKKTLHKHIWVCNVYCTIRESVKKCRVVH